MLLGVIQASAASALKSLLRSVNTCHTGPPSKEVNDFRRPVMITSFVSSRPPVLSVNLTGVVGCHTRLSNRQIGRNRYGTEPEFFLVLLNALVTPRPDVPDRTIPDDARRSQTKKLLSKNGLAPSGTIWSGSSWRWCNQSIKQFNPRSILQSSGILSLTF